MLAKKEVFGVVDIDGLQGPSEVLIIADESAKPEYCAADLLAQAEHDNLACAVLVTTSRNLSEAVVREVDRQVTEVSRQLVIKESLQNAVIALVEDTDQMIELANSYAPEHLCIIIENAAGYVDRITSAGCIVAGSRGTVVLGDYVAGPSHALPTGGTARFSSPLNICDFLKFINVIIEDRDMVERLGPSAALLARAEGLDAHARAVERRLKSL
jgi:histidinol dehydrogenase